MRGPGRKTAYVSFPPVPSLVFVPAAAIWGERATDVFPTVLLAACVPVAFLAFLRRLREAGHSRRTEAEDLWLAGCLTFGTVFYFAAVQGRVWFTAHVVGVLLAALYGWAAVDARRPLLAGLLLGLAVGTRPPMAFLAPLFVFEAWRVSGGDARAFARRLARFALPLALVGAALAAYNRARFGEWTEFGHGYLAVRQQAQIEQHGRFSLDYTVFLVALLAVGGRPLGRGTRARIVAGVVVDERAAHALELLEGRSAGPWRIGLSRPSSPTSLLKHDGIWRPAAPRSVETTPTRTLRSGAKRG